MNLLHFLEKIDLECSDHPNSDYPNITNKKALRLDGQGKDGLRWQLGVKDQCNCCDYLLLNKDKVIFIEISDLITQLNQLRKKQQAVSKEYKQFLKEPLKYIHQEMKLKVFGSLIILFKIPERFKVTHEKIHKKQLEVIFVICSDKADDVRIFDYLKTEISSTFKPMLKEAKIINVQMFNKYLYSILKDKLRDEQNIF